MRYIKLAVAKVLPMNLAFRVARRLPLLTLFLLVACNSSVADQPITGNQTAPPAATSPSPPDTTAPATSQPVPFVNPTKVGRALGEKSPSPPASRTR